MSVSQSSSVPDVADHHRRLLAYALLALGVRYAVRAAAHFVDPDLGSPLGYVADAFALVAVGLIVPIFVWKMRNASRADEHLYKNEDGFVAQTIAAFFDLLLALMILTFSGAYFYLDRESRGEAAETSDA